jgi:hypothetical protein
VDLIVAPFTRNYTKAYSGLTDGIIEILGPTPEEPLAQEAERAR